MDRNVARGLLLAAIALLFGAGALQNPVGSLARPGPAFFPLVVSALLLGLALVSLARARLVGAGAEGLDDTSGSRLQGFRLQGIGLVTLGLVGFFAGTKLFNMALGIVLLVFIASFAATTWSLKRSILISIVLIGVAIAFQKLLGLNLGVI